MKLLNLICVTFILVACGGNGDSNSSSVVEPGLDKSLESDVIELDINTGTDVDISTDKDIDINTETDASVNLTLAAADVDEYIELFKELSSELYFIMDGDEYNIHYENLSIGEEFFAMRYEGGLILIGFDFELDEFDGNVWIRPGDITDINQIFINPDQEFYGTDLNFFEESDSLIIAGDATETSSLEKISIEIYLNESVFMSGNTVLQVNEKSAEVSGILGAQLFIQLTEALQEYPELNTLKLVDIQGSVNDDINMHTGRLIRDAGLNTFIPFDSEVVSGGIDLFAAGVNRLYQEGAQAGVHSWCCLDGESASELPVDHPGHIPQREYFREMLGDELGDEFYYFTINAAEFDELYFMNTEELTSYLLAEKVLAN